ncbi:MULTISPECIES: DUF935 domain-containing protein [unclassified Yoonia]|uniref:DUF935 domain-containing protein n=1 Tax=unclassified Yoonia TaxID=2629118 RepID=UPI002AFE1C9F|nr:MULTISPECIES: DUF935 domain-containing protein [unclassified Yoonia]
MDRKPVLMDQYGRPVKRAVLTQEVSAATIGGVRSPLTTYPGDGLNPVRLANILRAADQGDPIQYLELAETIEERDPHYLGVVGTRKRAISQLDITVEAASEDPDGVMRADMVRDWLRRDELTDEFFDILDAVGKGYSFTEIIWDSSSGEWQPQRLEWRDPRWFRFDRVSLTQPMQLDAYGQERPLDAFKFIHARLKAKSGIPLRSGLARVGAWGWMFKAFTQRDWAIFTQTFGQPLRVGKWGAGASEADKDTLFNAVANIAGDCAAIIPESMTIDFVETKNVGSSATLYKDRADWLDQQISKAVLGQTATTDAVTGGLGSGKEHRQVQEDIERADAKALSAILNRDLIIPWMQLNFGPLKAYPRLRIGRPEQIDAVREAEVFDKLYKAGLPMKRTQVYDKFGYEEPGAGDAILGQPSQNPPPALNATAPNDPVSFFKRFLGEFKRVEALSRPIAAVQAQTPLKTPLSGSDDLDVLIDRLTDDASPAVRGMLEQIEAMLSAANSFDEFREMLHAGFPDLDAQEVEDLIADAQTAAYAGGYLAAEEANDA